jgi:hypothetical protein
MTTLVQKVLALSDALQAAAIPHAFGGAGGSRRRVVPFAGEQISVLGPVELVLFKALFDRPKDWVDIATLVEAGAVPEPEAVRRGLVELVGPEDPRVDRWAALAG